MEKHKNIDNSHTLAEQAQMDSKILSKEVTVQARIGKLILFIFPSDSQVLGFIKILWVKYVRWLYVTEAENTSRVIQYFEFLHRKIGSIKGYFL